MSTEIRLAGAGDVDALVELHREVHTIHLAERPDQFKATRHDEVAAKFLERLSAAHVKVWIAERDGKAVGHAVAVHYQRAEHAMCPARKWWEVDEISVISSERRSGIGRALLRILVDAATSAGVREIELSSWAFNQDAHAAFKNFGFAPKVIRFELKR